MVRQFAIILFVGTLPGTILASDETTAESKSTAIKSPATPVEMRQLAHEAPRNHAVSEEGPQREQSTRRLIDVLLALKQDQTLTPAERTSLHGQVRSRLIAVQRKLRATIAKRAAEAKKNQTQSATVGKVDSTLPKSAVAKDNVLAQVLPGGIGGQRGPAAGGVFAGNQPGAFQQVDHGEELVDLIQKVISPTTWDVNGGSGSVVYYRNFHALVVRAPAEVHGDIGNVLGQLRK